MKNKNRRRGKNIEIFTHVITLASSIKSSSDMVPSFIILTATSIDPRQMPLRTTPNWPEPSSSNKCSSAGSISHLSVMENRRFSSFTFYREKERERGFCYIVEAISDAGRFTGGEISLRT